MSQRLSDDVYGMGRGSQFSIGCGTMEPAKTLTRADLRRAVRMLKKGSIGTRSCYSCRHAFSEIHDDCQAAFMFCDVNPQNSNLLQFPFRSTTCRHWVSNCANA